MKNLFSKSNPKRKPPQRAPRFRAGHAFLIIIVVMFGAASTIGAIATANALGLTGYNDQILKGLGGTIAMSIALIPILLAPAWAQANETAKAIGLVLITPLMLLDAASQTNTVMNLERAIREAAANGGYAGEPVVWWPLVMLAMIGFQASTFFLRSWLTGVTVELDLQLKQERQAKRTPKAKKGVVIPMPKTA